MQEKEDIGRLTWGACKYCIYWDQKDGGCLIDDDSFFANVRIDYSIERIICGCFKKIK